MQNLTVTLSPRDEREAALLMGGSPCHVAQKGNQVVFHLANCVELLKQLNMPCSQDIDCFDLWHDVDPRAVAAKH